MPGDDPIDDGVLDEAYLRVADCGPEFDGFLSNHAPMAADALIRLGLADSVETWLTSYRRRLEQTPGSRFPIDELQWRDPLGDASRLGDWCALFDRLVQQSPWQEVLVQWWPRLAPGAVASATHCLIRTGHAVRALRERETPERVRELGRALGYWAARWQPAPLIRPAGDSDAVAALNAVPAVGTHGGFRARLAELEASPTWKASLVGLRAVQRPADVPGALDTLVDAAVSGYRQWGHANPVMLVHAATGPRAIGLILPSLPVEAWIAAYDLAWAVSAAVAGSYRGQPCEAAASSAPTADEAGRVALDSGDEHAIKFAEVALESWRRGNPDALAATGLASSLLRA